MWRHPAVLAAWIIACTSSAGGTHRGAQTALEHPRPRAAVVREQAPAEELAPAVDATRLLRVRITGGHWSHSERIALIWSDGTVEIDTVERHGPRKRVQRLTPEQMQRVRSEMPVLSLCDRDDDLCTREDATDLGSVHFEVFADGRVARVVMHYQGSDRTPREFIEYESFVLSLLKPPE